MPRPLTFGIELEFAFATLPSGFKKPLQHDTDGLPPAFQSNSEGFQCGPLLDEAFTAINTLLQANNIRTVLSPLERGNGRHRLRHHDNLRWHLKTDVSILGPNRDYYWLQVELVSPVLQLTPDGITEAVQVASLIQQNFRVSTNNSTGMHVHIGDEDRGLPLELAQRVMGFWYVFDEVLAPIHPPSRQKCEYARNIRAACMLPRHNNWSVVEALEAIMNTDTIEELEFGFGGRRPAVNLKNLRPGGDPNKKTIEFRQHAGTLDPERVEAWIELVGGVVDWCRNASEYDYNEIVEEAAEQQDQETPMDNPTILDLLMAIGLDNPADFYESRLSSTNGKEPEGEMVQMPELSEEYVFDSSSDDSSSDDSDDDMELD